MGLDNIWTVLDNNNHFMAVTQLNLCQLSHALRNWMILEQSFTVRVPLLTVISAFWLGKTCLSSPQRCYLHHLHVPYMNNIELEALRQCIPPPRHVLPMSQYGSRLPPIFNHFFVGSLPTFPENFMQIHLEIIAKLPTDRQINDDDYISSLAAVMKQLKNTYFHIKQCVIINSESIMIIDHIDAKVSNVLHALELEKRNVFTRWL